jgi:bacterioferritin-associated ferredoxin
MYVCICHRITDKDIQKAAQSGCCSLRNLQEKTCLGTQCGNCIELAQEILTQATTPINDHPGN